MTARRIAIPVLSALVCVVAPARAEDVALDLGGGAKLELRRIPKGTFTQGSPPGEVGREGDETQRPVTITRGFWMAKTPVTRAQFARFVGETSWVTAAEKGPSGGLGWDKKQLVQRKDFSWRSPGFDQTDDHPVVMVTLGDADAFVTWASSKTRRRMRLPTEAEWEYAARAGTTTPWYSGKTEDDALAAGWLEPNAGNGTRPVGKKTPNAFGLFDMVGNVYEWCRDVYAPYPVGPAADPENDTANGSEAKRYVLRSGSWRQDPKHARSAARWRSAPGTRSAEIGFRVVVIEDDALLPGLGEAPLDPFASRPPPVGASGTPLAAPPAAAAGTPPASGGGWAIVVVPLATAAAVVAWVLARRRRPVA